MHDHEQYDDTSRPADRRGMRGGRGPRRGGVEGPGDPWARGSGRGRGGRRSGPGGFRDFGGFDGFGEGPFFGRGPRAARGDVRAAILRLLAEEPMHGYQLMREIRERSGGVWKPSPGSIYPTLQQLEDEDLVTGDGSGGKKVFHLTDSGKAAVAAMPADAATPWHDVRGGIDPAMVDLRRTLGQVGTAVMQVVQVGTSNQLLAAQRILADTRRQLYRLLAEEDEPTTEVGTTEPAPGERDA